MGFRTLLIEPQNMAGYHFLPLGSFKLGKDPQERGSSAAHLHVGQGPGKPSHRRGPTAHPYNPSGRQNGLVDEFRSL